MSNQFNNDGKKVSKIKDNNSKRQLGRGRKGSSGHKSHGAPIGPAGVYHQEILNTYYRPKSS